MHKLHGLISAAALLVLLGGCAGMEVQKARNLEASGTEFHKGLYAGYLDLSESEFAEGDYWDSDVFAGRATMAAAGSVFGPEDLDARKLPGHAKGELAEGRRRLLTAFEGGARTKAPTQAAKAQTMFDCWMQEQEEDFQPDDIAKCRTGFMDALATIEDSVRPVAAMAPEPAPKPAEPVAFRVYFDFDSAKIPDDQQRILIDAVASLAKKAPSRIVLSAHADRAGAEDYNQTLSEQRAMAVQAALAERGLTNVKVESMAYGETRPYVDTPDGVSEKQNRVVSVSIEE
jgi:outer membrane protein OmpA-like peptidoglycan-associated protein